MKDLFPEYYDQADCKEICETAIFVFDACSLVNVYWYAPKSSIHLITILERLSSERRLWMPYQFATEYHKLLPRITLQIENNYAEIKKTLLKFCDIGTALETIKNLNTRSGFRVGKAHIEAIEIEIPNDLKEAFARVVQEFEAFEKAHVDRVENCSLKEKVAALFEGACQISPFGEEALEAIYREGQVRHERGDIPPISAKDMKEKQVPNCYGDLVAWQEILLFASKELQDSKLPIVLVTEDKDWLDSNDNARSELIREMYVKSGVRFFACKTKRFRELAEECLLIAASDTVQQEDDARDIYSDREEILEPIDAEPMGALGSPTARSVIQSSNALKNFGHSPEELAKRQEAILRNIGLVPEDLAKRQEAMLKNMGFSPEDLAKRQEAMLKNMSFSPEDLAKRQEAMLKNMGFSPEDLAKRQEAMLTNIGLAPEDLAKRIDNLFKNFGRY